MAPLPPLLLLIISFLLLITFLWKGIRAKTPQERRGNFFGCLAMLIAFVVFENAKEFFTNKTKLMQLLFSIPPAGWFAIGIILLIIFLFRYALPKSIEEHGQTDEDGRTIKEKLSQTKKVDTFKDICKAVQSPDHRDRYFGGK